MVGGLDIGFGNKEGGGDVRWRVERVFVVGEEAEGW